MGRKPARRAEMLLSLRYVDYVHVFDEPVPMPFLDEVRPDVHVNGAEYGEDCVEAPLVKQYGGRIHVVERIAGLSTTHLAEQLATPRANGSGQLSASAMLCEW